MKTRPLVVTAAAVGLLWAGSAEAHLRLQQPLARYGDSQKTGPCGIADGERTVDKVYTFEPGETVMLVWDEYINHPGHFRISFDDDGHDDFVDPAGFDDFYSAPSVLVDAIPDQATGGVYNYSLTLPDVECDNCTLQVVQVMTDKAPYGDGNDLYYQCVDLILERGGGSTDPDPTDPDPTDPDPTDPDGETDPPVGTVQGACSAGGAGASGGALLLLAAAFGLRRRRRR